MSRALLLSVRFHDGRYHGARDWPPSPARLFQALVAGAARGRVLTEQQKAAFRWLESLGAPAIAAPVVRLGRKVLTFVPNNDLDAVGGDPSRVGEIRTGKVAQPYLFEACGAFLYGWTFRDDATAEQAALAICRAAEELFQLGRGIDAAWARGEVIAAEELDRRLVVGGTALHRPAAAGTGNVLLCPVRGSLESLLARFDANLERFDAVRKGKRAQILFAQPPKPRFRTVAYDSPPRRSCFELQKPAGSGEPWAWPQADIVRLVEGIRTASADRLVRVLRDKDALVERLVVGRGAGEAEKSARIRIVALPSIGHEHADRQVRRVLVEVPANCPLAVGDIEWSCSGLELSLPGTNDVTHVLVGGAGGGMLEHYGIGADGRGRLWRTVTPAALPLSSARRRIEPGRRRDADEWKGAAERAGEERRAIGAVVQALRHAGIAAVPRSIRVQREPFAARGMRAEAFASGTRFAKERLWHVEILFDTDVRGPVVIGNGRYLGLGLMAPEPAIRPSVFEFRLHAERPVAVGDRTALLHAVRRALMALSRDDSGAVPRLFSGHEPDGGPAAAGRHEHLFLGAVDVDGDGNLESLIVAAPWACDRTVAADGRDQSTFGRVVGNLKEVRAGRLGIVALALTETSVRLLGPGRTWRSHTPYQPTRRPQRGKAPAESLVRDVTAECLRRGLPQPDVEIEQLEVGLKGGNVSARLRLRFATAVEGPLLLGRDSHRGGGLFEVSDRP